MKFMGLAVSRDSRVPVQCQIGAVTNLSTSSIWGKHKARLFASQQLYRDCEMISSILWIISHTQEQRKSIKCTLRTRRHYWPLLSIFTHWPLLKFHILRQPSLPPVTSLQVKIKTECKIIQQKNTNLYFAMSYKWFSCNNLLPLGSNAMQVIADSPWAHPYSNTWAPVSTSQTLTTWIQVNTLKHCF